VAPQPVDRRHRVRTARMQQVQWELQWAEIQGVVQEPRVQRAALPALERQGEALEQAH